MQRRAFISGVLSGVGAGQMRCQSFAQDSAAKGDEAQDDPVAQPSRIVDAHVHFFDPDRPEGVPWPSPNSPLYRRVLPADFRRVAADHGVDGAIVIEASPWLEDNQWMLDLAEADEGLLGVVGNLALSQLDFVTHLDRFAAHPKFLGLRVRGADLAAATPAHWRDLRALEKRGLSLDVLGGAAMLPDVLEMARRLPELTIVIDHFTFRPLEDEEEAAASENALERIADQPRVFAKISNVLRTVEGRSDTPDEDVERYRDRLDRLWDLFGPERVIYGSDWPVSERRGRYSAVVNLMKRYLVDRDAASIEAFFWKNSQEAYGWGDGRPSEEEKAEESEKSEANEADTGAEEGGPEAAPDGA